MNRAGTKHCMVCLHLSQTGKDCEVGERAMVIGEMPDGHRLMPTGCSSAPANMRAPPFAIKDGERCSRFLPEIRLGLMSNLAACVVSVLLYWAALVPGVVALYYILDSTTDAMVSYEYLMRLCISSCASRPKCQAASLIQVENAPPCCMHMQPTTNQPHTCRYSSNVRINCSACLTGAATQGGNLFQPSTGAPDPTSGFEGAQAKLGSHPEIALPLVLAIAVCGFSALLGR